MRDELNRSKKSMSPGKSFFLGLSAPIVIIIACVGAGLGVAALRGDFDNWNGYTFFGALTGGVLSVIVGAQLIFEAVAEAEEPIRNRLFFMFGLLAGFSIAAFFCWLIYG